MKIYKLISLVLILAMVAGVLLACRDDIAGDTGVPDTDSPDAVQPNGTDDTPARLTPNLPDADFQGHVFTFLTHHYTGDDWVSELPLELVSEEQTGEPISDAVFRRNMAIMERFNIDIRMIGNPDEAGALRRAVGAGDSIYDAVLMFNNHVPGIVTGNLLLDTDALPYVDLTQPWWDDATQAMSVANRHFLLAGDILILDNEATNALLFNKELMADFGHQLPYALVHEGRWTMDALHDLIRDASADLDGDGTITPNDRHGLLVFNDSLHAFLVGGGGTLARKDADDIPYMTVAEPRNISVFDRAIELFDPAHTLNIQQMPGGYDWTTVYLGSFEENRALFMWVRLRVIEWFRGMDSDFGILPMPKFNEGQERHYSAVNTWSGALLGVPRSAYNLERISIILEALAAESRYTLQPAYYDIVLTRQFTRDEESEEMLDIIFANRVYDVAAVYGIGDAWIGFIGLADRRTHVTTFFERNEPRMLRDIEQLVDTFEAMD